VKVCAEAGAIPPCRAAAPDFAALIAPASAHYVSRKYRSQIFHRWALDTSQIKSASIADPYRNRDRYTTDRNFIDRRTP